jgi:catechol 2,3-dioxygenase-like lactoylglutathione lyase family enzyme
VTRTMDCEPDKRATIAGLNHISIPVRDAAEAVRFWTNVFGAEVVRDHSNDGFAEVRLAGMIFGFATQSAGWTGMSAEFPHYGFAVEPENMRPLKDRLSAFGVPTHEIWTRMRVEALMYFRDPSGNLFEFYCPKGYRDVNSIPVGVFGGGNYQVDLEALNYRTWNDPGK